jgi:F0F1-type ATP synthase membrane subunit b/b'
MITVDVKGVLIGILLIALIVLVVFLIVMIANVTDTIKKANAIIDGGTNAAKGAKDKVDDVNAMVKERASQAVGLANTGVQMAGKLLEKVLK